MSTATREGETRWWRPQHSAPPPSRAPPTAPLLVGSLGSEGNKKIVLCRVGSQRGCPALGVVPRDVVRPVTVVEPAPCVPREWRLRPSLDFCSASPWEGLFARPHTLPSPLPLCAPALLAGCPSRVQTLSPLLPRCDHPRPHRRHGQRPPSRPITGFASHGGEAAGPRRGSASGADQRAAAPDRPVLPPAGQPIPHAPARFPRGRGVGGGRE